MRNERSVAQTERRIVEQIGYSVANGVAHVVINRPERKNSLTDEMYKELAAALDTAAVDSATKVLLFSGAGGVFTAGNDLDDFVRRPPKDANAPAFCFLRKLTIFAKPVVAAVEGLAIGVGTTMLLHCDLVYSASDARFALPFVNLGLVPEAGSSLLLPRLAGYQRAAEKLLLGEPFPASEAQALGFVNRLLPSKDVLAFALSQAERLAGLPARSVQGTKALMKRDSGRSAPSCGSDVLQHMDEEIKVFAERLNGPALLEAISAFKEKRKANFDGLE